MLKSLLYTMLPTCKIYLDEDDNDEDDEVEAQVEQASALLVFLTAEYVGSRKCMLELTTAWRLRKPLIVVRQPDGRDGGLSAKNFEAEVALHVSRHLHRMSNEERAALAWLQSAAIDGARVPDLHKLPALLFSKRPSPVEYRSRVASREAAQARRATLDRGASLPLLDWRRRATWLVVQPQARLGFARRRPLLKTQLELPAPRPPVVCGERRAFCAVIERCRVVAGCILARATGGGVHLGRVRGLILADTTGGGARADEPRCLGRG